MTILKNVCETKETETYIARIVFTSQAIVTILTREFFSLSYYKRFLT